MTNPTTNCRDPEFRKKEQELYHTRGNLSEEQGETDSVDEPTWSEKKAGLDQRKISNHEELGEAFLSRCTRDGRTPPREKEGGEGNPADAGSPASSDLKRSAFLVDGGGRGEKKKRFQHTIRCWTSVLPVTGPYPSP